ncbi:hypothetical protein SCALM49S_08934 [Streptomyces californicus]
MPGELRVGQLARQERSAVHPGVVVVVSARTERTPSPTGSAETIRIRQPDASVRSHGSSERCATPSRWIKDDPVVPYVGAADAQHRVAHPVLARVDQVLKPSSTTSNRSPPRSSASMVCTVRAPACDLLQHLRRLVHRRHPEPALRQRMRHPPRAAAQFEQARPGGSRARDHVRFVAHGQPAVQLDRAPSGAMAPGPVPAYPSRTSDSLMST